VDSRVQHEEHDRQDHQEDCQAHVFSALAALNFKDELRNQRSTMAIRWRHGRWAEVGAAHQTCSEEDPEETVEDQCDPKKPEIASTVVGFVRKVAVPTRTIMAPRDR